ncbi:NAD-dependent epimerase/dehydratase family protein [Planktothrix paucivesiculata]|uniref:NAD-dependent epimerase/dehydratase n=1 Tax=Planktothrix paucivesiculata PCC 9631 TaxID=671071 RepID=A0A7Z9BXL0_9CYAN|nr:NAD-dependent epimerase/dehydratase family protein [Planktothrix paucivesiculata]VXD23442.1 NAD-dependent epimerase/dehydratase [Planktothrix paucivesiculata PCC 9631]
MKVLVTGANGFTGSYLTKHLLDKGYEVRVLVRKNSNQSTLEGLPIEYAFADIADDNPLEDSVMAGVEIVYHIAALYRAENVPREYFWDVNVKGTRKVLEAAKKANVKRFVHCSTVGVQGEIKNPPAKEEDPYSPGDYYQESKMEGELLALDFFKKENLAGCVVRPVGIYGPGDLRFLKLFKYIYSGKFKMIGSGEVLYHLTYVEDLAAGIALAGEKEAAIGEIFTIGGNEFVTLNQLVQKIADIYNKPVSKFKIPVWPVWWAGYLCELICLPLKISPPIYRRRVDFFIKDRAFDISKAQRLLGYQPKVPLDEGLKKTALWYKDSGLLEASSALKS